MPQMPGGHVHGCRRPVRRVPHPFGVGDGSVRRPGAHGGKSAAGKSSFTARILPEVVHTCRRPVRFRPPSDRCAAALFFALTSVAGCRGQPHPGEAATLDETLTAVRQIRVLLGTSQSDIRIGIRGEYELRNGSDAVLSRGRDLPWSVVSGGRSVALGNQPLGDTCVEIEPEAGGVCAVSKREGANWSEPKYYAGLLRLLSTGGGEVQIINDVDLELYVAGVLPGELYPNFHRESYRAQAIAARTYALFQMSTSGRADYDVSDGEAAQVYEGVLDSAVYRQACAAVEDTRGLVCTWTSRLGERIFCTFFSSACGGRTQDVANCKAMESVPPLSGGVICDYCRIAKGEAYRWPTRIVPKDELLARLVSRYPTATELGKLANVTVPRRDPGGRPVRIGLVGTSGKSFELGAENFRLAVGSRVVRSTDCNIRVEGDSVLFEDGKGFGHGLGLCQWGMEGQAREGRTAAEILRHYYPESHLTRAY